MLSLLVLLIIDPYQTLHYPSCDLDLYTDPDLILIEFITCTGVIRDTGNVAIGTVDLLKSVDEKFAVGKNQFQ